MDELADIGYAFVLLTPDDTASSRKFPDQVQHRARQNVIFEHGLLIGLLGQDRVCAIVKGDIEFPSDIQGIMYKRLKLEDSLNSIAFELVKELRNASYQVDANKQSGG